LSKRRLSSPIFLVSIIIVIITIFVSVLTYVERDLLAVYILGPFPFRHWMGIIGSLWIAAFTPLYVFQKRRNLSNPRMWLNVHIVGNLVAFSLICVHFTYRISNAYFIGTGLALFIGVLVLVTTGFLQRFYPTKGTYKYLKFLHVSMTTAFYLILVVHITGTFIHL
jgi:VanZ family protein